MKNKHKIIPVSWPVLEKEELSVAQKVLKEGWLGMGKYVEMFEKDIQNYLGTKKKYICCVSTGSDALLMSLMVAKVKKNDEVILPSLNFIAGAQAIMLSGAKPIFCDVDERTLCIDPIQVEKLITKKTKAIIAVDYSGHIADYEKLNKIKKKFKRIRIIQDAAHSFGSFYKNKKIGTFADITMFSFDPIKTITSLDGGAVVVNTKEELNELRSMRQLGFSTQPNVAFSKKKKLITDVKIIGMQNRMTNLHAAVGIEQLKKIKKISKYKMTLSKNYNNLLKFNHNVSTPDSNFKDVVPFIYYIRVDAKYRDNLRIYLRERKVMTGLHWQPNHIYSLFKKYKKGSMKLTNRIGNELITLPLYVGLKRNEQIKICKYISDFFKKNVS